MGFFKDFRSDSSKDTKDQPNDTTTAKDSTVEPPIDDELDEDMYKDMLAAAQEMIEEEAVSEDEELEETEKPENSVQDGKETKEKSMGDYDETSVDEDVLDALLHDEDNTAKSDESDHKDSDQKEEEKKHIPNPDLTDDDKDAVTIITKGTTVNGNIVSDCSLDVCGTVNGDIECLGKLTVSGKVTGNSLASEVYVRSERLLGAINAEGIVDIGQGTVVIGDITATAAVIAGAVKGEIDINGHVILDSTAVIKGNIKAKSVQMNNGAVLEGFCSLTYAKLDIDHIFE